LNVERARELYRIQRADLLPAIGIEGAATRASGSGPTFRDQYSVSLGLAAFEIDLFGRARSLARSALERYFATESSQRTVQLSLIAEDRKSTRLNSSHV